MATTTATDSGGWSMLEPRYTALRAEDLSPDLIPAWLARWSDLEMTVWEDRAVRKRAMYRDVTDAVAAEEFQSYTREIMAPSRTANRNLVIKLLAVAGYEPSSTDAQMVRRWRNEADLTSKEDTALLAEIGALERAYLTLTTPFAQEQSLSSPGQEDDILRQRLEASWRAGCTRWLQHREQLNQLFLELLTLRQRLARQAGLPNYRAYRWRELNLLDYPPEDVLAAHDAVAAEIVPLMTRWRLNRQAPLKPWEAGIEAEPQPALQIDTDAQALVEGVARMVGHVDPAFGDLFNLLHEGFLHLGTDPKQAPVNEEFLFPQSGHPCIFVSPRPSFEDIATLLHESGHAFHDSVSQAHQSLWWNVGGPDEFCEFAANSMIMLANPYLDQEHGGFYSVEDAARARTALMVRWCGYYLPRIAMADAFQHWVYAAATDDVGPSDLDAAWLTLSRRFMPDEDWDGLETERMTGWQQESSLFVQPLSESQHSLALLGALQIGANVQHDHPTAVRTVREALALGSTRPSPELYEIAGARWPFDGPVVRTIARYVTPYIDNWTVRE
jgi:oligoendopeptidase F